MKIRLAKKIMACDFRKVVRRDLPWVLGFYNDKGCILAFNTDVNVDEVYESYRFAKLKYLEVVKH